jgi:hypothetical protein
MKRWVVFLIYAVLILVMTYPLVFHINTHIPGFFSTDEPFYSIWNNWRIKDAFINNLSLFHTDLISYPFGVDLYANGVSSIFLLLVIHLFSLLFSPVAAHNIQILINMFLNASFAYLLTEYLTRDKKSSIVSGIIFAFSPYQFMRIWQHLGLTYNQWIPLLLYSAIILKERYSKLSAVLFLISLVLALGFDYSVAYISLFALLIFIIYILSYRLSYKLKNRESFNSDFVYLRRIFMLGIASFLILSPFIFSVFLNIIKFSSTTAPSVFNSYRRPFEDLFIQSAKPLGYLLPAIVHPVFGRFTEYFIGSQFYGTSLTEHTLYVGFMPLVLSLVAARYYRRSRRDAHSSFTERDIFFVGLFILLTITAWVFSQPPYWQVGRIKIFMPSYLMYKILPMYRAYCRFGILVVFGLSVLAAFGLRVITAKLRNNFVKSTVICAVSIVVLFEFWNYPPLKVINVTKMPPAYDWLKKEPASTIIAEYPLDYESPNELYKLYQTKHAKKMINSTIPGLPANDIARNIKRLSSPTTAGALKFLGVDYVLVHKKRYLDTEKIDALEELRMIPQNKGLKIIKSFDDIDVYRVVCSAIDPEGLKNE